MKTLLGHPQGPLTLITRVLLRHDTCILRKKGNGIKPGTVQLHPDRAKTRALHQLEAMGYHVTLDRTG